mgnify:FL=1
MPRIYTSLQSAFSPYDDNTINNRLDNIEEDIQNIENMQSTGISNLSTILHSGDSFVLPSVLYLNFIQISVFDINRSVILYKNGTQFIEIKFDQNDFQVDTNTLQPDKCVNYIKNLPINSMILQGDILTLGDTITNSTLKLYFSDEINNMISEINNFIIVDSNIFRKCNNELLLDEIFD